MMQKAQIHSDSTFESIFEAYRSKVYRICLGYVGNAALADDLCQEVFVTVWKKRDTFRGEAALGTWIYRIAVNTCLGHLRKTKTNPILPLEDWHVSQIPFEESTPDERIQLMHHFIRELGEIDRLTLSLLLEEVSYEEIAQILGTKENALRVRIHRIKSKLAKKFNDHGKSTIS